jgi:hypothetical protein
MVMREGYTKTKFRVCTDIGSHTLCKIDKKKNVS